MARRAGASESGARTRSSNRIRRKFPSINGRFNCAVRLRDLLRLGNNPTLFRNLKRHLYRIAEKHLSVEYVISEQEEGWGAIEAEVVSSLPDIFDCEGSKTLVNLACQIIKSYHHRRRYASKNQIQSALLSLRKRNFVVSVTVPTRAALKKEREAAKNRKENDIIDITLDDNGENDEKSKLENEAEFVEPKLPLMTNISNRLPGSASIKRASRSTSPPKFGSSQIAKASTLRSPVARMKSQNTPIHAESSSQARPSNNASFTQGNQEDAFKLTGVTRLTDFLNACSPPMAHFLQPLINFGCTSEEYLVAVSAWPTDKILHFLRQVVGRESDKREFTQMDMLVLQNHFVSYFTKARET